LNDHGQEALKPSKLPTSHVTIENTARAKINFSSRSKGQWVNDDNPAFRHIPVIPQWIQPRVCGRVPPKMTVTIGSQLGTYEITALLGKGASGKCIAPKIKSLNVKSPSKSCRMNFPAILTGSDHRV
jgi:hypothetical protein